MKSFLKALFIALGIICIITVVGLLLNEASNSDRTPSSFSFSRLSEDANEHIYGVKYGSPSSYPNTTYADAFGFFFGSPKWTYFRGSTNDSGNIYDVVEFTGTCMFRDAEVSALIQFTLSEDGDSFSATYLSFNDVPQDSLMLGLLIDKAFSEYEAQQNHSYGKLKPVG